jgi:hypothetical protein
MMLDKTKQLTKLSAILKGLVIYKTDMKEIERLREKYPEHFYIYCMPYA